MSADDGAHLYPEGHQPCLVCGRIVPADWDGPVVWHFAGPLGERPQSWCPGSRTSLEVPA